MINFTSIKLYRDEQLRDYQLENKLKIYEHLEVYQSVMLQMPTGTGKTRLFASIVKDIHNLSIKDKKAYKVLILAHRNELIKQISENVGIQYGIAHGKIMSKNWEEDYYPTQVASVQTLIRRLDKWGDKKFDFIIIDEAHHALAPTYVKICNEFPEAKVLGVTATPYRMSKSSFRSMFDELIVSESISEFIKKGYLSEYEYYSIKPSSKIQNLVNNISEFDFDGDYAEKALSNTFDKDKIRANLLDTYFKYAGGKKGIIYTINKSHNEHVCRMFIDAGIIAKAIDSGTNLEERNRIVKDFKNGNIQILCNVNIFSEGFDCPDVEFIQLARPTKSLSMYLQQVGRGFRIHEDKEKVIFLDNVGLFNRFGLPSANRKWLKHFNGSKDIEEYSQDNNYNGTVRFIEIDIEEGNEEIELIFNSNNTEEILINKEIRFDEIEDFDLFVYEEEVLDLNNLYSNLNGNIFFEMLLSYDDTIYNSFYESLLIENDYNSFFEKYTNIKKVIVNKKIGLWDTSKSKLILEPNYDEINFYSVHGKVAVNKDGKTGVFNPFTEFMEVPAIYDNTLEITMMPNYHIVELKNKYGIISQVNNLTIEPFSDNIIEYNGYFNIITENEWLLYDPKLDNIEFKYFELLNKFGDYYIITYQNLFGFSDANSIIFPFLIKSYKIISHNRIIINYQGWSCLLDENLDFIVKPNSYKSIEVLDNKFLKVKNNRYGILTFDGIEILQEVYYSCEIVKNNFIVRDNGCWKSFDLSGNELKSSKKRKSVVPNENKSQKKKTTKNLILDEIPINSKYEDPNIKIIREQLNYLDNIKNIYEEIYSTHDNFNKTIRINKIKSELHITNSEIASFFKIIGINFIDNPNAKLTESEYVFIKTMKERNI